MTYNFDKVALSIATVINMIISFINPALAIFGYVAIGTSWIHIEDPKDKNKEYLAYYGLTLFVFAFIVWVSNHLLWR